MVDVLTEQQELAQRSERFQKLTSGSLFSFFSTNDTESIQRWFVAISFLGNNAWRAVELTQENRRRIVGGEKCSSVDVRFDEMTCLIIE